MKPISPFDDCALRERHFEERSPPSSLIRNDGRSIEHFQFGSSCLLDGIGTDDFLSDSIVCGVEKRIDVGVFFFRPSLCSSPETYLVVSIGDGVLVK